MSIKKNKRAAVLRKKTATEAGLIAIVSNVIMRSIIISAAAFFIGLTYTGLRAALVAEKKEEVKIETAMETAAEPTPVPTKVYIIPDKFKHLFNEIKTKEEIPKIHLEEAKVLYESGKALFIDARNQQEYDQSHIPGSIYIGAGDPSEKIKSLADKLRDKVLVTYCHGAGCHLSDKSAFNLFDQGYRKLIIFFGGWPEWTQAQMPVEKYQPPERYKPLFEEAKSADKIRNITLEEAKFLYDNNLAYIIDVDYPDKYNQVRLDRADIYGSRNVRLVIFLLISGVNK